MLIFHEVESLADAVSDGLTVSLSASVEENNAPDHRLMLSVLDYVRSLRWLTHQNTRKKLKVFFQCRFDYKEAAERLRMPVDSLHRTVSYANKRLRSYLQSTLTLIKDNRWEDAKLEFERLVSVHDVSSVFVAGTMSRFIPCKSSYIDVTACEKEIKYLAYFTTRSVSKLLGKLEEERMAHLLYVLGSNEPAFISERLILHALLVDGTLSLAEALEELQRLARIRL